MYLDQSTSHHRFAAYQMDADAAGLLQQNYDAVTQRIEREYQLGQQEISSRIQTARISAGASTANARTAANASRANAKLAAKVEREKLALAREEMERIGIPDMEIRRFVAEKNYEIAKLSFGLDVIKTATEYRSTPDQYWMARDFEAAIPGLLGGNLRAPTSAPTQQPQPQSLEDLVARLTGGTGGAGSTVTGTPAALPGQQPGAIPTTQAAQAVAAANPPSPFAGLSESDAATLKSIQAIYEQGLNPFAFDKLNPNQQGLLVGGGKRLGRSVETDLWRMNESRPGQASARAA